MNLPIKTKHTPIILLAMMLLVLLVACSSPIPDPIPEEPAQPPDRVDLVYFYDSNICQCDAGPGTIILGTLYINFGREMATGQLTFQSIDINESGHAAIADKYGATSLSLFMSVVRGDTEQIVPVPEIAAVKDDDEAIGRLVIRKIGTYFEVD